MHKSRVFILVFSLVIILFIALFYISSQLKKHPVSTPQQQVPPAIAITYCRTADVKASIAFQGAAGTIYENVMLTNTSTKKCQIIGDQYISLTYDKQIKNITILDTGAPMSSVYTLSPNASLYALIHMPNGPQCSSAIKPVLTTYTYQISNTDAVTFEDSGGKQQFTINACPKLSEVTEVSISPWSDKPTTQ